MSAPLLHPTDPDHKLTPPPASASLEAVLRFQESLWERGVKLPLEEIIADRPTLRESEDALLELICQEVVLREEGGETPSLSEYQARFPHLSEQLRLQWQVDGALMSLPRAPVKQLGRYEVQEVLGKGGMGVAYRAWDTKLKRVVAVKTLRTGEDADEAERTRFRTEAEAIARVRHPNIVQIHDVGEHDGQPYFAMEFCPGGALAERLNGSPLPAREAASVLEQVARGVAAAHEQRIVHRDLKPGNVLLSPGVHGSILQAALETDQQASAVPLAECVVKVTDFGLAKKLDADQAQTHTGAVMGTPAYMAPEQAFGQSRDVGPAADIYALGAIFYECLTGRPPFKGATVPDTLDLVRHTEPVPVRQLQPRAPLPLETICLKCLQKEPGKRYATATEVADDLRRFLDGRPIVARPIGALGRAWLWSKRNRTVATLLAATVLTLVTGIVTTSLGWRAAKANLAKADENFQETYRAVDAAFTRVSQESLLEQPGMMELRRELLLTSLPFYEKFVAERKHDPRWRMELADANHRLSRILFELGSLNEALAQFKESLRLYQELNPEEMGSDRHSKRIGSCLLNMGHCYKALSRLEEAEHAYQESQTIHRGLVGEEPALVEALHYLADVAYKRGALDLGLQRGREAATRWETLLEKVPDRHFFIFELGSTRQTCADILIRMGRYEEALVELEAAVRVLEPWVEKRSRQAPTFRACLAKARANQGRVLLTLKRFEEAEVAMNAANEEFASLMNSHPTAPIYARDWAANQHNLALVYRGTRDHARAVRTMRVVVTERERLHREQPHHFEYVHDLSDSYRQSAILARDIGKADEFFAFNGKCIAHLQRWLQHDPADGGAKHRLAKASAGHAQFLTQLGRHAESLPYWDLALENGGAPDPWLLRAYRAVARAIVGDWRRAELDLQAVPKGKPADQEAAYLFTLGCVHAAMAEAVRGDTKLLESERQTKAETWTQAALGMLADARKRGHQKEPWNLQQWKAERALSSLRSLPEFQALLPR